MRLAAVTGCTADFTIGTAALLRTLRRHHPEVQPICFTPNDQVNAVQSLLGDLAQVRKIPRRLANAPDDPKIQVSWSRVFLPAIDADCVAWFDSDVILCRPAPEWWAVPPGKVNVVADRAYRIRHMVPKGFDDWYFRRFPLNPESPGFNAGIMALRPSDHPDLSEKFEQAISDHDVSQLPFAFDQGILNGLLHQHLNFLPSKFNAHCLAECGVPHDVRAIHYTGSPKPWSAGYDRNSEGYYHWIKNGADNVSRARLLCVRLRTTAAAPRRFLYKAVRKVLTLLGLWHHEIGIGSRPNS